VKAEICRLSKQAGLFIHDKPAYACLATRVPAGTAITKELLEKIERAESELFDMGFTDFRVRVIPVNQRNEWGQADYRKQGYTGKQGDKAKQVGISCVAAPSSLFIARIQIPENQWNTVAARRADVLAALQPYFNDIVLDLKTR
jgi:PP-loop superfamily ATP-utilizing enzyme